MQVIDIHLVTRPACLQLFSLACPPHKPAACKDSGNLTDNKLIKKG